MSADNKLVAIFLLLLASAVIVSAQIGGGLIGAYKIVENGSDAFSEYVEQMKYHKNTMYSYFDSSIIIDEMPIKLLQQLVAGLNNKGMFGAKICIEKCSPHYHRHRHRHHKHKNYRHHHCKVICEDVRYVCVKSFTNFNHDFKILCCAPCDEIDTFECT